MKFWWAYKMNKITGDIEVGIKCDDETITFDGRFICLVPRRPDEENLNGATERAELLSRILNRRKSWLG
jgi:hypothetical protein